MKRGATGQYKLISTVGDKKVRAFIPDPLPPNPPLNFDSKLQELYERSLLAVGGLSNLSTLLPDTNIFIYNYVRKEAVLSSQIEGTQSSLDELLLYESTQAPGAPLEDVQELINYVRAIDHGMKRLRDDGFPLSLRLIREIHGELLAKGRGSGREPGEFRRSQNWVGGDRPGNAVFVPPPPENVMKLVGDLENFLHDKPEKTPTLIKAALSHVQFETIHPFLDGNGRVGRLLIALVLFNEGVLSEPILYLSLYFKIHRRQYYDLLQSVRTDGDWEGWLSFFFTGVRETSEQAVQTASRLTRMFENDREKIKAMGKAANSALRIHQELQKQPIISIPKTVDLTGLSQPTVTKVMKRLADLGMVKEIKLTGKKRAFSYSEYIRILGEGTEPITR
jgi:Fic family protein